jgi:hypothetical protein
MIQSRIEENGIYQYNKEQYHIYGDPNLSHVNISSLTWLGHFKRMNGNEMSKEIIENAQMKT